MLANIFCEVPDSKYFRPCLCHPIFVQMLKSLVANSVSVGQVSVSLKGMGEAVFQKTFNYKHRQAEFGPRAIVRQSLKELKILDSVK